MKTTLISLALLAVSVSSTLTSGPAEEITQLINQLDEALVNRDYDVLNAHYAEDMKLVAPNGAIITRDIALAPFKNKNRTSKLRSVENTDLQITADNGHAHALMITTHSFEGGNRRAYRNLLVLAKEEGIWKVKVITSINMPG